ncbi:MAG TPA: cyclase family protein [Nitrososphaerales archaeon]|nr:cyclase family protein [Nitrososphaerales archaeon]
MLTLLSHHLSTSTPAFNNGPTVTISPVKQIATGGSSNNYAFSTPCHNGTHMDCPNHFDDAGRPVASFTMNDFVFERPSLIEIPKGDGELFTSADLTEHEGTIGNSDLLLIRTGYQKYRNSDPTRYSTKNPGFSAEGARYLLKFPRLRAIGFDFISLSSVLHREEGREAHRALLKGREFFILEDMDLSGYPRAAMRVVVAPIFLEGVDSTPCTVFAET